MLLLLSIIIIIIVAIATISKHLNIPLIVISLGIGIIFGSDVTGLIYFDDAKLTKDIANIALIFILFYGGYGTKKESIKPILKPVILLSTIGVIITALSTGQKL